MSKYYPPKHLGQQFNCVHCGVFAAQTWVNSSYKTSYYQSSYHTDVDMYYCFCSHCNKHSYWFKGSLVVPSASLAPQPHPDLPDTCLSEYNEARDVLKASPKAAAALLRLVLQKLMKALGEKGDNINNDIGSLVEKGLPVQVQQALDFCRVVGNNAVHPGEIDIDDSPDIAYRLFEMMNFIVDNRITQPKTITELYSKIPEGARESIERRDGAK